MLSSFMTTGVLVAAALGLAGNAVVPAIPPGAAQIQGEVVTRCAAFDAAGGIAQAALGSAAAVVASPEPEVLLVRRDDVYDIVFASAFGVVSSASAYGGRLSAASIEPPLLHLTLIRRDEPIQHFLFTLAANSTGRLLWARPSGTTEFSCSGAIGTTAD